MSFEKINNNEIRQTTEKTIKNEKTYSKQELENILKQIDEQIFILETKKVNFNKMLALLK